jgi:hypothetical protein
LTSDCIGLSNKKNSKGNNIKVSKETFISISWNRSKEFRNAIISITIDSEKKIKSIKEIKIPIGLEKNLGNGTSNDMVFPELETSFVKVSLFASSFTTPIPEKARLYLTNT